jgi:hypothetical protein
MVIIYKSMGSNKKSGDAKSKHALWDGMITKKKSIGQVHYVLVYGMYVTLHIHLKLCVYQLPKLFENENESFQASIHQLVKLDENRRRDFEKLLGKQEKVKSLFDKNARPREFNSSILFLMWDRQREKPRNHGKLNSFSRRTLQVESIFHTNSLHLSHLDKEEIPFPMNGKDLKMYYHDGT